MDTRTIRRLRLTGALSLGVCLAGASSCPKPCTVTGTGVIWGTSSADVICGSDKDDVIYGFGGDDELRGYGGDDRLLGGEGNDVLNGGAGNDWADFSDSSNAVFVNLANGAASPSFGGGTSGSDSLISIRRVEGSPFDDFIYGDDTGNVLNGNGGDDYLFGGVDADTLRGGVGDDQLRGQNGPDHLEGNEGNDFLQGGRGDDEIIGGPDSDWASYADAPEAVGVLGGGSTGGYGNDTLTGIESVEGSEYDDYLAPTSPDTLRGRGGNDWLYGDDTKTTIDYSDAPAGVTVDLVAGTAAGGDGDDTLVGIKHIIGSWYADSLTGDNQRNTILGGNGNDLLYGKANDDTLDGEGGVDAADGGSGTDDCTAEATIDCE